ncbi:MAG: phosphopantetheine adenylyltransferase [Candidatus Hepatoplasma vulgare]|nr:MAG: phosphopantetheine adenylyltransferase [Candidatus Hepatoplasma sp.]
MSKAIFPGSFDPIHNGHIKVILLASRSYDEVYIYVANNEYKNHIADLKMRYFIVKKAVSSLSLSNVTVFMQKKDEKTPVFAKEKGVNVIIRGNVSKDHHLSEYESRIADEYLELNPDLTFHYFSFQGVEDISSTLVRHYLKTKKSIEGLVPNSVLTDIKKIWTQGEE